MRDSLGGLSINMSVIPSAQERPRVARAPALGRRLLSRSDSVRAAIADVFANDVVNDVADHDCVQFHNVTTPFRNG